jgi:hypothetical protein
VQRVSVPGDIRTALAFALSSNLSGWSVSATWRAKPEPPQIDMMLGPVTYDRAMHAGNEDVSFIVRAVVQAGEDSAFQEALDPLIDWAGDRSTSLKAALENDKTLGGVVSSLRVSDVTELKAFPFDGGGLPGVEFTVLVTPNG